MLADEKKRKKEDTAQKVYHLDQLILLKYKSMCDHLNIY